MASKRINSPTKRAKKRVSSPSHIDPSVLAADQSVKPIHDPQELFADFWPEDETADEFVDAVRRWRREGTLSRNK